MNKSDCMKVWRKDGFSLRLYYLGTEKIGYTFRDKGKVIFEGDDFRPSPLHSVDSLQSVYSLLGFLSLKPGDTDKEYFEAYTPQQLEWCTSSRCEELGLIAMLWEEKVIVEGKDDEQQAI